MTNSMSTPCEIENLRARLQRILQSYQLRPADIKKDQARIHIHNIGSFECNCSHQWHSGFSWLTFDLKELEICKRWTMKCQYCLYPCIPSFSIEQIEKMFDIAVQLYKGCYKRESRPNSRMGRSAPHIPELCEKCGWGQTLCWKGKLH